VWGEEFSACLVHVSKSEEYSGGVVNGLLFGEALLLVQPELEVSTRHQVHHQKQLMLRHKRISVDLVQIRNGKKMMMKKKRRDIKC